MQLGWIYRDRDRIIAIVGIWFSLTALAAELTVLQQNVNVIIAALLVLTFCGIWLRVRNRDSLRNLRLPTNETLFLLCSSMFFILFGSSILLLHLRPDVYVRPTSYFLLTAAMAGVLGVQILASAPSRKSISLVLVQIVILGLSLTVSQLIIFPNVVGVDPWTDQWITLGIISLGHVPANTTYTNLPMFHLEAASTALMTSLDYKLSALFSVGLSYVLIAVLFTFLLGRRLINEKVGLLAALVLVTANSFIWLGYWIIPNTLGAILLLVAVYEILRLNDRTRVGSIAVILVVMVALIFTHTVSAIALALAVSAGVVATWWYQRHYHRRLSTYLSYKMAAAFIISMFVWWTYGSGSLSALIGLLRYSKLSVVQASAPAILYTVPEQIFTYFGLYAFFVIALIGSLYMLSEKFGRAKSALLVVMGLPLVLIAFSNVLGIYLLQERWAVFAQIFFAVPVALSLMLLSQLVRRATTRAVVLGSVIFFLSLVMILSPTANIDNHLLSPNTERLSLTASELQAITTLSAKNDSRIVSDAFYMQSGTFFLNKTSAEKVTFSNETVTPNDLVVVRQDEAGKPVQLGFLGETVSNLPTQIVNPVGSKIYSSGSVDAYTQS